MLQIDQVNIILVMMDLKEWSSSSEELNVNRKCCADCKTTKTPLWRGGPAGPKVQFQSEPISISLNHIWAQLFNYFWFMQTLCNACGIRYRKRRAMKEMEKN